MADQTEPRGGAGADHDPWAPPERKTSLEKGGQPAASGQQPHPQDRQPAHLQPSAQPPLVHDQATVTSLPGDGFAPPGPGYGPPGVPPAPGGWSESAVPPPPIAPTGPGGPQGPAAPGGYGYPAYPQGYGWPGMQPFPQNGMGTAAMVLGILSCCMFCVYGIVSLVLGVLAVVFGVKGKQRADRGEATNRGQAQAGFITGIVGIVLGVAVIVLMVFVIVAAVNEKKNTVDTEPSYNSAPSAAAPLVAGG
ncbi:DUF4190 domain-containing protein [Streptomyces guryensis]|uniref:DUF4190 domain-containing protein n=1 Tax=Streptomyces guryensis TaxID=2886947 RepID=A0A9Q3VT33_9ACTN|nr:DUF4190 domain-containing protein [Streptomyces guryensis]MCD9876771.1 DUF4190 domain-containing protein [Streptomyces guryensis]